MAWSTMLVFASACSDLCDHDDVDAVEPCAPVSPSHPRSFLDSAGGAGLERGGLRLQALQRPGDHLCGEREPVRTRSRLQERAWLSVQVRRYRRRLPERG